MDNVKLLKVVSECIHSVKKSKFSLLSPETTIAELDLDSLHEVELLMMIDERVKVDIQAPDYYRCKTVRDFMELIRSAK